MPNHSSSSVIQYKLSQHPEVKQWLNTYTGNDVVAFTLRWTLRCRQERRLYDDISCSRDVGFFWSGFETIMFGKQNKRKLKRFLTLEKTDGFSWHLHGLCEADRFTAEDMALLLDYCWRRHIRIAGSNWHTEKHLVEAKRYERGCYGEYCIKHIDNDNMNSNRNIGTIDAMNTN
ncbi:hypothetical protein [Reyranella sp.]|uniref:hypothetical protein n=1 Tax=Reyranella sp. TaxID=1929291 RepID=UPI00271FD790|nr:hypothetical protein [Reyranella sp.]MDO8973821.1 hypothetical protein [Reyranella sp.]